MNKMDHSQEESASNVEDAEFFGPSLPPHYFKKSSDKKIYGPMLPATLSKKDDAELSAATASTQDEEEEILIGPELPECSKVTGSNVDLEEEMMPAGSEEDNFGPSTTLMASGDVAGYYKYMTSQNQSIKNTTEPVVERETWMTELPDKKRADFGLLPRHFKTRIQTDKESDSSVWTDTPADKKRKEKGNKKDHKEILKRKRLEERDKEMEKLVKKAAKKLRKKESLLEIHQKNMKKKEKKRAKEEPVPERRPFDRNVDLQIPKFDENQKRSILNKSQFLNDRFAAGESKFL